MSAGLPGFGLGGLLFVICALLGPFAELARTARGTSSLASWRRTWRQFALAAAMVAAFELVRRTVDVLVGAEVDLRGIVITAIVLAAVVGGAKALELAVRARRRLSRPTGRVDRRRSVRVPGRYSPASPLASDPEA